MSAPTPQGSKRSSRTVGCEIFAALMKGDHTARELMEILGITADALYHWLIEMRASGLIYRRPGKLPPGQLGRNPTVYCLQTAPFDREDWQ